MFTKISESSIKLEEIKLEYRVEKSSRDEFKQHLGFIPIVYYNEIQVKNEDLIYFQLFLKENIPQLKISFRDSLNIVGQKGFPIDNTKLKIFINSRSDEKKSIFMQFKVISTKRENGSIITMKLSIDLDDLYTINYESFSKNTSFDVMKKIAKQLGLGFYSNISSTNDKMNWINYGRKVYQFLKYVSNNGYISDNDFCSYYIDYYYNLNYINLQKELLRDTTNDELLVSNYRADAVSGEKTEPQRVPAMLTTDASAKHMGNFIQNYKIINNSTSISIEEGYLKTIFFYDNQKKEKLIFNIDTLVDNTDNKTLLTLKSPNSKEFYKNNYTQEYIGKLDVDNIHSNYGYADLLNNRNLQELEKITLVADLPEPNFTLYIFQKIKIQILNPLQGLFSNIINERLSGNYLITNIKFEFSSEKGFIQIVHLSRRDLSNIELELK